MSWISEGLNAFKSKLRGDRPEEKNEIIAHEWLSLEIVWKTARTDVAEPVRSEIDKLFTTPSVWQSGPEEWQKLNTAEQTVGTVLAEPQLTTEFAILLELARARKLANLAAHESNAKLFETPDESEAAVRRKRVVYIALLDDLQRWFINTRFNRRLRSETASRLFRLGLAVLAVAILPFLIYFIAFSFQFEGTSMAPADVAKGHKLFSSSPFFGLGMVAAFGLLGAYFSRVMRFQTSLATLGFDDVMNIYQPRMLYVRLLYGTIGAVIFYFLLRSGIIAGSAFPNLANISVGEQIIWKTSATTVSPSASSSNAMDPSGLSVLAPTADLAKLLVWSFLAGFSERLIPDALDRTEARARNGNHG